MDRILSAAASVFIMASRRPPNGSVPLPGLDPQGSGGGLQGGQARDATRYGKEPSWRAPYPAAEIGQDTRWRMQAEPQGATIG